MAGQVITVNPERRAGNLTAKKAFRGTGRRGHKSGNGAAAVAIGVVAAVAALTVLHIVLSNLPAAVVLGVGYYIYRRHNRTTTPLTTTEKEEEALNDTEKEEEALNDMERRWSQEH